MKIVADYIPRETIVGRLRPRGGRWQRQKRTRIRWLVTAAALWAFAIPSLVQARPAGGHRADDLGVNFDTRHPGRTIPKDFLGLSFEVKSLPLLASYATDSNLPRLLRSISPGVMRFGGTTSDTQVAWSDGVTPRPPWATTTVVRNDFQSLASLAEETNWRSLLTLNLGHYDTDAAAQEALAAKQSLGSRLTGFEFGNEPDSYVRKGLRVDPWGYAQYRIDVNRYRDAVNSSVPGFSLAGPDRSSSPRDALLREEAADQHPALLTAHFYPLGCHDPRPPQLLDLLGPRVRAKQRTALSQLASISRATATRLRIDETNSVSCGGKEGVSNTLASALWATDYLAQAMSAGIAGINFHDIPNNCRGYAPLCAAVPADLESGRLHANPEWYAMLLARELEGDRPLSTRIRPNRADVSATAFAGPRGRVHVVIVDGDNSTAKPLLVHLGVSKRYSAGTVLRLEGPSLAATSRVSLGGRQVSPSGAWDGLSRLPRLVIRNGSTSVAVAPGSAVLVTLLAHR